MKHIITLIFISLLMASCVLLSSCGQDGPLYLPQKNSTQYSQDS